MKLIAFLLLTLSFLTAEAQQKSKVWNPNNADGTYTNPVIDADYSDPDVCRVGNDYYMTSSSFACFPGLQILQSFLIFHADCNTSDQLHEKDENLEVDEVDFSCKNLETSFRESGKDVHQRETHGKKQQAVAPEKSEA